MFLVEKANLTSHFKLTSKKPSPLPQVYQQAAKSFDEKVILHLKNLTPASDFRTISLDWMSKAVSFLSIVHSESLDLVLNSRSETDYYQALYMDYSQKVLDLSNLISSAVQQLTERRLLLNLSLRLLTSSGNFPAPEKLKKAKDALTRSTSVHCNQQISKEKAQRAKDLIEELRLIINKHDPSIGKASCGRDLIRRTLHGLGSLTVFVASVLVSVLYGESDPVEIRVPAEFRWADSVNDVQKQVFNLIKPNRSLLEVEETSNRAVAVCDVIDEVTGEGGDEKRVRLEDGVEELRKAVSRFSGGVDELTNGVNDLFNGVLKTRNGVLDGVRKGDW